MVENENNASNKIFEDKYNLTKCYYKELKLINLNNQILTKDDIIVINDLIRENTSYISELFKSKQVSKATQLLELNTKMIDVLLLIYNSGESNNKKLAYILSLKLSTLEIKFQILFIEDKLEEAEKTLNEIMNIQDIIKLPKYYQANSSFYLAVIKFCI